MKRAAGTVFKVFISILLYYYIFSSLGIKNIADNLSNIRPVFIVSAILVFTASNFLGALQWKWLLDAQRIVIGYLKSLNLYFIGLFFNNILPGSLGGDIVKVYSISRLERKGREGLAATFVDRFAGFFVLSLFSVCSSIYLLSSPIISGGGLRRSMILFVLIVFGIFLLSIVFLFSRRVSTFIYEIMLARFNPFGLRDKIREIHGFFHLYRDNGKLAFRVLAVSVLIQGFRVLVHYLCARAIGFDIDLIYFLLFVPLIAMVAAVPISFGGLGVRESFARVLFISVASIALVDPDGSLIVTTQLLASAVGILVSLPGGLLFIFSRTAKKQSELEKS